MGRGQEEASLKARLTTLNQWYWVMCPEQSMRALAWLSGGLRHGGDQGPLSSASLPVTPLDGLFMVVRFFFFFLVLMRISLVQYLWEIFNIYEVPELYRRANMFHRKEQVFLILNHEGKFIRLDLRTNSDASYNRLSSPKSVCNVGIL